MNLRYTRSCLDHAYFNSFFSGIDCLVEQMDHFVEELPVEWTAKWEPLKKNSRLEWDHIPSMPLNFCIGLTNV